MPVRITQAGIEVVTKQPSEARITQAGAEVLTQGGGAVRLTQAGVEVAVPNAQTPASGGCDAVESGTLAYRLRIRNEADDADELVISSLPDDANPYLLEPPDGDGQEVDPARSTSDIGAFTCKVIDAVTSGTDRIVTAALADSDGRYQLLSRRAYIEESADDGDTWTVLVAGYVNRCALVDALVYEFTIGEARRNQRTRKLFVEAESPFDRVSNVVGTPVRGGFGPLQDYGGWRMEVDSVGTGFVILDFLEGLIYTEELRVAGINILPEPEFLRYTNDGIPDHLTRAINEAVEPYGIITNANPSNTIAGRFPGLVARLELADGTFVGEFTPLVRSPGYHLIDPITRAIGIEWTTNQPDPGDEFFLWIYPKAIDERNPVHLTGHPVDLAASALELAGATVDAGQKAITKSAVGDDAFVSLRITKSMTVADFVEMLGGVYGFTTRAGLDGETEFIPTRNVLALPTTTITSDCLRGDGTPFTLDEKSLVNSLTVTHLRYDLWLPDDQGERPFDILKAIPESVTYDNGETATKGTHPLELEIPGRLESRQSTQPDTPSGTELNLDQFVTALGDELFQRFGRGADVAELPLLRGEHVQVGELLTLDLDYLPNGSSRGGAKVVQVVQVTPTPEGPNIRVMAIAGNVQTATVPTFTIVANSDDPLHYADITLTNGGSLPAGGVVRVEWARGSSITSGTLLTFLDYGAGQTTVSTPGVAAGSIVSARMRVEIPGQLPGAWTGWQSVDLTDLQAPTGLTATPIDAQSFLLEWTNTETDFPIEVLLKLQTDPAFSINPRLPYALLPAGSVQYVLSGLTPGVGYTAGIRYREIAFGNPGGSQIVTVDLNPAGTAPTLNAPTSPSAWAGRLGPGGVRQIDGTFGLDVLASEIPSFVEFEVAVETAPSSGTFGSFTKFATVDAVQGGPTRASAVAPNDGRLRALRARHTRAGYTASSYTSQVTINPWSPQAPGVPTDAEVLVRAVTTAFPSARVVVDGDITADFTVANQVTFQVGQDGRTCVIMAQFGDGVAAPNVNALCGIQLPFDLDVLGWTTWGDQPGSAVVDVLRTDYTTFSFASIAASAKPTLSAAAKNRDTTLTGWTTALDEDDLLQFKLESLTTCKLVVVALKCRRRIS